MALPLSEQKLVTLPEITYTPSPSQSERIHGNDAVDLIVVHTPQANMPGIHTYLKNGGAADRKVSYHLMILKDGKRAFQYVRWGRKAWHAGVQNSRSDGIAIEGFAAETRAFSPAGRAAARAVAKRLKDRNLPPRWNRTGDSKGGFCRHADIQSDRSDPMPLSRWLAFVAMVKWQYHRGGFRKFWGYY